MQILGRFLMKLIRPWVEQAATRLINDQLAQLIVLRKEVDRRLAQVNAISAVDLPVARDAGFIVVVAKINGQPRVHLTYIPPNFSMAEWRRAQHGLEESFGARTEFIDAPSALRGMAHAMLCVDDPCRY